MSNHFFRGPESVGFVVLGATAGALLASFVSASLIAPWAGGIVGAVLTPVAVGLPWRRLIRRAISSRTSSAI